MGDGKYHSLVAVQLDFSYRSVLEIIEMKCKVYFKYVIPEVGTLTFQVKT